MIALGWGIDMRFGVVAVVAVTVAAVWFWPQIESVWRNRESGAAAQATISTDSEPALRAPHFDEDRPAAPRPRLRRERA